MNPEAEAWQPACSLELLRLRARLSQQIRRFFEQRSVLEVETPLLCRATGTDPNLDFFSTRFNWPPESPTLYLQTSPEFAMKRLLAAGSGSIYQIAKAFRNGETGRYHNPEFTILEWYRVGFDLDQLMDEAADLTGKIFGKKLKGTSRQSYSSLFKQYTGLDCLKFDLNLYSSYVSENNMPEAIALCGENHALWLDFIFSHAIQDRLKGDILYMIYGYPACLPSLAKNNSADPLITQRVELFINGVELGNGYDELTDSQEQERRFDAEIIIRTQRQLPEAAKDKRLLAALKSGLPACSGMAIGLDRVLMLLSGCRSIQEVLAFPIGNA